MKSGNNISLSLWTKKGQNILEKAIKTYDELGIDKKSLPAVIYENQKPISLVFAGQFSAGKSTILKALTGISDIKTGECITTQEAQIYDWNGLHVIDTPGIHTTLRPDHDVISYEAIANADMLVYVVTHELFDSYIGQKFRQLLLEKDKADEMILIVNKMADVGNSTEIQKIKTDGLRVVTDPYTPEQLRICFVDAESYLDSINEEDEEIAAELYERSNYEGLVSTINEFVQDKSISSKLTTSLYKINDSLQKAIVQFQPSSGDKDIDALEEHLLQERRIIFSTQWRIEQQVKAIYQETATCIRDEGRKIANAIYDFTDEVDANNAIEEAYKKVEELSNDCTEKVVDALEKLSNDCKAKLDDFYNTDFSKELQFRLNEKQKNGNPIIDKLFKSDVLGQASNRLISNTVGKNATATGLRAFSGSNMHQVVLDVGHFFGHSFKPWEAVKWVKGLNTAGKVLGVFGVVFSLGMQVKEDVDSDKQQLEMRHNREVLRAGFNDAANALISSFDKSLKDYVAQNYFTRIHDIDMQIEEIRSLRNGKSDNCKVLEALESECKELIHEIHMNEISE
ncbi:GTPase [Mediterraneibacter gnavus]|uniref:GTPase n=1 Tax=Mediterraneibacter gnavus TaxID=33038 RepID=A0A2N5PWX9_MEDGN|nr:GTPase [Mediterraneibacter gnavus]PLT82076.1 GTPase [Mediterraneibacter gnavus]